MFRKLDLFPPSGKMMGAPTLLSPLETANINHWTGIAILFMEIEDILQFV
jgi:hypothetical protein